MKVSDLFEDVEAFETTIKDKYNLTAFSVFDSKDTLTLSMLEVPKADRKAGVGTAVMTDLINYADSNSKRIILTPGLRDSHHGTTSRSRLVKFYKRFGFVENKGRAKDFTISQSMYRDPR